MGFIHQKKIIPFHPVCKKTLQTDSWIKHIIVIADNHIHPNGQIQAHFKGAYLPFFCMGKNHLSGTGIRTFGPQFKDRIIDPVHMAFCSWTMFRITLYLLTDAELFLCCQHHGFYPHSLFPEQIQCICRYGTGNGSCGQIKNLIPQSFPHGFQCRKQGR